MSGNAERMFEAEVRSMIGLGTQKYMIRARLTKRNNVKSILGRLKDEKRYIDPSLFCSDYDAFLERPANRRLSKSPSLGILGQLFGSRLS